MAKRMSMFLGSFIVAQLIGLPAWGFESPAQSATKDTTEWTVGTPWVGSMGVTETIEQIMARDARLPPEDRSVPVAIKNTDQPEPLDPPLDPASLQVSRWPANALDPDGEPPVDDQPDLPQTVDLSFVGAQLNGPSGTGALPPDSMGAVGPTQYLVGVNNRIRLYTKTGTLSTLNTTMNGFFASVLPTGGSTSDPQVRYDRLSGRWFVIIITVSRPNHVMIAVSNSSTLVNASSFTFYIFQQDQVATIGDVGALADYPSLGIDNNALYIGANMFNPSLTGSSVWVVRKSSVLSGGPIVATAFRNAWNGASGPYSPRGVDNDDPAATEGYFIGPNRPALGQLAIRRITNPGGTPAISSNIVLTVPSTAQPINVPALGSTTAIDALNDRLFMAHIHANRLTGARSLWTAHHIQVNSSGVASSSGGRDGCRWYEIGSMTGTPTLIQSGTLFDSAASSPRFYWFPAIAVSGQGHMALGCSYAGATEWVGVAIAGRLASDPLGTIQAATLAQAGLGSYENVASGRNRWGDYSFTCIDPDDDMTMWTIQEYASGGNNYACRVLKLLAPPPATPASCAPPTVAAGDSNVSVVLTGTSVSGSGFFDPDASYPNHITASVNGGDVTVNSITFDSPTQLTLDVSVGALASATGRTITVTNPDGQALTSAGAILTITCAAPVVAPMTPDATVCGSPYTSGTPTATGSGPLTWSLGGTPPVGMTIDINTGVVSWPNPVPFPASYNITVEASNGCGSDGEMLVLTVLVGDFNGDGVLDDLDIPALVDHVLGLDTSRTCAADVNGDTFIDGLDIVAWTDLAV